MFDYLSWLARESGRWNVASAVAIETIEARVHVVARFPGMGIKNDCGFVWRKHL